jgi:hypothetical protein
LVLLVVFLWLMLTAPTVFDPFELQVLETSSLEGMQIAYHQRLSEPYQVRQYCSEHPRCDH